MRKISWFSQKLPSTQTTDLITSSLKNISEPTLGNFSDDNLKAMTQALFYGLLITKIQMLYLLKQCVMKTQPQSFIRVGGVEALLYWLTYCSADLESQKNFLECEVIDLLFQLMRNEGSNISNCNKIYFHTLLNLLLTEDMKKKRNIVVVINGLILKNAFNRRTFLTITNNKNLHLLMSYLSSNQSTYRDLFFLVRRCFLLNNFKAITLEGLMQKLSLVVLEQDEMDFKFEKSLDEGAFGNVGRYRDIKNNASVAIKIFKESCQTARDTHKKDCLVEIDIHSRLRHQNIIDFKGVYVNKIQNKYGLVLELASQSLLRFIAKNENSSWQLRFKIMLDVFLAFAYLHSQDIVHGDVKAGNILIAHDGTAKLADFGCAREVYMPKASRGTVFYQDPLVLKGQPYFFPSDIYSLGLVMWELGTRTCTWEKWLSHEEFMSYHELLILRDFESNKQLEIPKKMPVVFSNLIKNCWCKLPSARPQATEGVKILQELSEEFKKKSL